MRLKFSPNSLGALLALAFTLISVALTVLLTAYSDRAATASIRENIGNNLAELAHQTTARLDRSMFGRYREVRLMANRIADNPEALAVRFELDSLQESYPRYAWIGMTDLNGRVVAATRGMLEGVDVSQRPWFGNALKDIHVGDVHDALLLSKLLGASEREPLRFVDIAFPLKDDRGQVIGVLGAHLSWEWATDIQESIFLPGRNDRNVEPLIVSSAGTVLLGPADLMNKPLSLPSLDAARSQVSGYTREVWPDGHEYLVGYSHDQGYDAYPGLGWRVLVRQRADEAFAPVDQVHQRLLMVGAALAVVFSLIGWWLAGRITRPLNDLVDVARGIEAGYAVRARTEGVYTEGATLGRAFNSLIEQLQRNEAEVRQLNVSLERRVAERTAEMEDAFDRLSENEARVQTLIETAQDPFVAMDFEGRITEWNTQAEKLFGWRRDEVLGESLAHTVLPERYQAAFVKALARYHTTGEAPFTNRLLERTVVNRQGVEIPVEMKIGLINSGSVQLFSAFVHDISKRKEVERLKNEFVSTVSHELRTPLTSIYVSLSMLESGMGGDLPADVQELMKISRQSCERLIRLINDVLDVEKLDSHQFSYTMKRQPLRPLVDAALHEVKPYAEEHGVRLVVTEASDGAVMADADRIVQVITNLLSNAAKFSPPGEAVQVLLRADEEHVHLSVVDHGPGIPPEFRPRVFERFAQADSSDRRQKGGTGLGLNICRSIVTDHGGSIGFESEPGVRTEFHFSLPRA